MNKREQLKNNKEEFSIVALRVHSGVLTPCARCLIRMNIYDTTHEAIRVTLTKNINSCARDLKTLHIINITFSLRHKRAMLWRTARRRKKKSLETHVNPLF